MFLKKYIKQAFAAKTILHNGIYRLYFCLILFWFKLIVKQWSYVCVRDRRVGGAGEHVPPPPPQTIFLNYNALFPPPNIETLMVPPPPPPHSLKVALQSLCVEKSFNSVLFRITLTWVHSASQNIISVTYFSKRHRFLEY